MIEGEGEGADTDMLPRPVQGQVVQSLWQQDMRGVSFEEEDGAPVSAKAPQFHAAARPCIVPASCGQVFSVQEQGQGCSRRDAAAIADEVPTKHMDNCACACARPPPRR